MIIDFTDIFGFTAAILQLIFSAYLFTVKKGKKLSNNILAVYFLLNSLRIFAEYTWQYAEYLLPDFVYIFTIGDGFAFLFGPLLYFYTKSIVYKNFKFRKFDLFHGIPYLMFFITTIFKFHIHDVKTKVELIYTGAAIGREVVITSLLVMDIQIILYVFFSLLLLKEYKAELKKYYSTLGELNFSWLRLIFAGYITVSAIEIINFVFNRLGLFPLFYPGYAGIALNFIILFFIILILFKGLKHPEIFQGIESKEEKKKYEKSTLTSEESKLYLQQLDAYMRTDKPYLNSSITLSQIANDLGIPTRHLSQTINENLGKNFFDYINNYRIEEAKNLLINPKHTNKTVLEILYEVGFNSKSVFNSTFKKITGITPTEFRKNKVHA